jgi:hypothetical protein
MLCSLVDVESVSSRVVMPVFLICHLEVPRSIETLIDFQNCHSLAAAVFDPEGHLKLLQQCPRMVLISCSEDAVESTLQVRAPFQPCTDSFLDSDYWSDGF